MKVEVKMDSVGAILRRRGLETGGRVQRLFTTVTRDILIMLL